MTLTYRPPKVKRYPIWPMRAVRDALAPQARLQDEMWRLENVYSQDTEVGPLLVGRPGFWLMEPDVSTSVSGKPFDDFNDNAINTSIWTTSVSSNPQDVLEQNRQLELGAGMTGASSAQLTSLGTFDLASGCYVRLVSYGAGSVAGFVLEDGPSGDSYTMYVSSLGVMAWEGVGGVGGSSVAYDPDVHTWWRMIHVVAGDVMHWQTAPVTASNPPEESDWVDLGTEARHADFDASAVRVRLVSNTGTGTNPGQIFDGVNTSSNVELGTTSLLKRTQLIHQFTKRDGTEISIVIVEGRIYVYDWDANTWSEPVTTANLTTASITLSTTARCYAATFSDVVVISDGVNTPFSWDGTVGAGGLTELTNAPVFYGPIVVYYAKLFGIKNTARGTFVWSEEGLPNTGYEAGGYNNAWDFVQTSAEGLVALAATNEALYVFRQNSCSAVIGSVTTDFQTTGTRDALDPTIGTNSPASVIVIGNAVWFVDQYGNFRRAQVGQGVKEIGHGSREYMRTVVGTDLPNIQAVDDVETGHVRFATQQPGGYDELDTLIWLDREDGRYKGREYGYQLSRIGILKDSAGMPTIIHGGGTGAVTAADGMLYAHGHLDQAYWNDGLSDWLPEGKPIDHMLETPFIGYDTSLDKIWVRGELSSTMPSNLTGVGLYFTTPNGTSDVLTLDDVTTSGTPLGEFVLDVDTLAGLSEEQKVTFQMKTRGRWCRLRLTHSTLDERLGLSELSLEAVAASRRPGVI